MSTNPFRYGDLALDEAFTDREQELATLRSDLTNGQNVALVAPRRYGKTSLLRRAAQALIADGVLVAEVDLMKAPTKEKLAGKLARAIHDDIASPLFRARERLRIFSGLRITPTIGVDPSDGSPTFSFSATAPAARTSTRRLERLLEAAGAAQGRRREPPRRDRLRRVPGSGPRSDPHLHEKALMRAVFQEQPRRRRTSTRAAAAT